MINSAHSTVWARAQLLTIFLICLGGLSACAVEPSKFLTFTNPPSTGQTLPTGQRFFACDTTRSARYMASTGFMPGDCQALPPTGADRYRVETIENIKLQEGEMWQIQLIGPEGPLWMPLPWHDWA